MWRAWRTPVQADADTKIDLTPALARILSLDPTDDITSETIPELVYIPQRTFDAIARQTAVTHAWHTHAAWQSADGLFTAGALFAVWRTLAGLDEATIVVAEGDAYHATLAHIRALVGHTPSKRPLLSSATLAESIRASSWRTFARAALDVTTALVGAERDHPVLHIAVIPARVRETCAALAWSVQPTSAPRSARAAPVVLHDADAPAFFRWLAASPETAQRLYDALLGTLETTFAFDVHRGSDTQQWTLTKPSTATDQVTGAQTLLETVAAMHLIERAVWMTGRRPACAGQFGQWLFGAVYEGVARHYRGNDMGGHLSEIPLVFPTHDELKQAEGAGAEAMNTDVDAADVMPVVRACMTHAVVWFSVLHRAMASTPDHIATFRPNAELEPPHGGAFHGGPRHPFQHYLSDLVRRAYDDRGDYALDAAHVDPAGLIDWGAIRVGDSPESPYVMPHMRLPQPNPRAALIMRAFPLPPP